MADHGPDLPNDVAPAGADNVAPLVQSDADIIATLRRQLGVLTRENKILKIAVAEMERISERDTLTPLYNRRFFLSALHQRIARLERYKEPALVIYVDVDQLKVINDQFGHAAGDFALIEIARRLEKAVRTTDLAARIGGDEFGLIMDHIQHGHVDAKVRQLADQITRDPVVYDGRTISVSASLGAAMLEPGMTENDVLARADAAMYANKRQNPAAAA